jgi:hypothetical protein
VSPTTHGGAGPSPAGGAALRINVALAAPGRGVVDYVARALVIIYRAVALTGSSTLASLKNFAASSGGVGLI